MGSTVRLVNSAPQTPVASGSTRGNARATGPDAGNFSAELHRRRPETPTRSDRSDASANIHHKPGPSDDDVKRMDKSPSADKTTQEPSDPSDVNQADHPHEIPESTLMAQPGTESIPADQAAKGELDDATTDKETPAKKSAPIPEPIAAPQINPAAAVSTPGLPPIASHNAKAAGHSSDEQPADKDSQPHNTAATGTSPVGVTGAVQTASAVSTPPSSTTTTASEVNPEERARPTTPPTPPVARPIQPRQEVMEQSAANPQHDSGHTNLPKIADTPNQISEAAQSQGAQQALNSPAQKLKLAGESDTGHSFQTLLQADAPKLGGGSPAALSATPAPASTPHPEVQFTQTNHPNIISSIRNQLLPGGGTMHLRLDPPNLGTLQVTVRMRDGVMNASFETSNDQAARLLSHGLSQLKDALESQGVQVDKLQVRQQTATPTQHTSDNSNAQHHAHDNPAQQQQQQQQQHRELMRRMWAKFALGDMPLDVTG